VILGVTARSDGIEIPERRRFILPDKNLTEYSNTSSFKIHSDKYS
jgi:hypothetical protein